MNSTMISRQFVFEAQSYLSSTTNVTREPPESKLLFQLLETAKSIQYEKYFDKSHSVADSLLSYEIDTEEVEKIEKISEFGVDFSYSVEKVIIQASDDLVLRVSDGVGNYPISFRLTRTGYGLSLVGLKEPVNIPAGVNVDILGILLVSTFVSTLIAKNKRSQLSRKETGKEDVQDETDHLCDRDSVSGYFRFSHNLQCNLPEPFHKVITTDGRLYMRVNCGIFWSDTIEIQALDCCKNHDINMWCAENNLEALAADEKVVACMTAAVLDQGMAKMNPWCGVLSVGYVQLLAQVLVLFPLAAIIAAIANLFHDSVLIGWDGRNRESCLCGGDQPTVFCFDKNGACRDVCVEAGRSSNCGKCTWECTCDDRGKSVGYKHIKSSDGKICCPGTQRECNQPQQKDLKKKCPDKKVCVECKYSCDVCHTYHWKFCPKPGVGRLFVDDFDLGLPCCPGTPVKVPKDFCPTVAGDGGPDITRTHPRIELHHRLLL